MNARPVSTVDRKPRHFLLYVIEETGLDRTRGSGDGVRIRIVRSRVLVKSDESFTVQNVTRVQVQFITYACTSGLKIVLVDYIYIYI